MNHAAVMNGSRWGAKWVKNVLVMELGRLVHQYAQELKATKTAEIIQNLTNAQISDESESESSQEIYDPFGKGKVKMLYVGFISWMKQYGTLICVYTHSRKMRGLDVHSWDKGWETSLAPQFHQLSEVWEHKKNFSHSYWPAGNSRAH